MHDLNTALQLAEEQMQEQKQKWAEAQKEYRALERTKEILTVMLGKPEIEVKPTQEEAEKKLERLISKPMANGKGPRKGSRLTKEEWNEIKEKVRELHGYGHHDADIMRKIGALSTGRKVYNNQVKRAREEMGLRAHYAGGRSRPNIERARKQLIGGTTIDLAQHQRSFS